MEVEALVEAMSRRFQQGQGAFFLGAGISVASRMPNWLEFLQPLASTRLDVELSGEDDLAAVAQYVVNANNGNRRPLIDRLHELQERQAPPNENHRWIGLTPGADLIWTTNYDELIEQSLSGRPYLVRHNDASLLRPLPPGTTEIIKPHGCINHSTSDELVLTTEDYEDFDRLRPGLATRLSSDLLRRSFLFVGYSYSDPDIRTALVQQRRVAGSSPPQHWMLLPRPMEPHHLFNAWCGDLTRVGIQVVPVDGPHAVTGALEQIAYRARGATVYITGSHTGDASTLARELGSLLATETEVVMLDGQSEGIGRTVVEAFSRSCVETRAPLDRRLRIFPNPYEIDASFEHSPELLPELRQLRSSVLSSARVVVAFPGSMGTKAEVEEAHRVGCTVIPVPGNGTHLEMDPFDGLAHCLPEKYREAVATGQVSADMLLTCVQELLK